MQKSSNHVDKAFALTLRIPQGDSHLIAVKR